MSRAFFQEIWTTSGVPNSAACQGAFPLKHEQVSGISIGRCLVFADSQVVALAQVPSENEEAQSQQSELGEEKEVSKSL